jgi:hypothetical protein
MRTEKPTIDSVLARFDIRKNRAGFICCPVHGERHPSVKVHDNWWYCHGCGANGDSIGLIAAITKRPIADVLRDYAEDVPSWKHHRTVTAAPPRGATLARAYRQTHTWMFKELARRMEGAPDWLMLRAAEYWGERFDVVHELIDGPAEDHDRAEVALRALAAECERGLDTEAKSFWDWVEGTLVLREGSGSR